MVPFAAGALVILNVVVFPAYRPKTVVERVPAAGAPVVSPSGNEAVGHTPVTFAVLRSASINGIDHRASGTATVRELGDRYVVGLEGIDIQPGPDYDVYVVPGADQRNKRGGARLDDLRGNKGTQFYDVPAALDLSHGSWTVLIWCQTFGVPVANATPA